MIRYSMPLKNDKDFISIPKPTTDLVPIISVPNPPAGSPWVFQVPIGVIFRPTSISFVLTTSATVINRYVYLSLSRQGKVVGGTFNATAIPASQVATIYIGAGHENASVNPTSGIYVQKLSLPSLALINPDTITGNAYNSLDEADQFSLIFLSGIIEYL